jgi:archaellin
MLNRLFSWFLHQLGAAVCTGESERGQTGMEIALVGVVCAACVLGAVVLTTGQQASQQFDAIFRAGMQRSGGTLLVNSTVVATADGSPLRTRDIAVTISVLGKPAPLSLDSSAPGERLVVGFLGATVVDPDVPFTATEIVGDHDGLLELGETVVLRVPVVGIDDGSVLIGPSDAWTLQITAPFGGVIEVSRTMPFALDRVNALR